MCCCIRFNCQRLLEDRDAAAGSPGHNLLTALSERGTKLKVTPGSITVKLLPRTTLSVVPLSAPASFLLGIGWGS